MTASTARPPSDQQHELLARLGLDDRASSEDIETTHDELVAFLTTAPRSLRSWARTQAAVADEAFALLTDPDAPGVPRALSGPAGRPTVQPDGPATPPARRAPSPAPVAAVAATVTTDEADLDDAFEDDDVTFEQLLAEVTPGTHRESIATGAPKPKKQAKAAKASQAASATATVAAGTAGTGSRFGWKRLALGVAGVAVVAIVAAGIFQLGAASNSPGGIASASPQPQASQGIDQARVSELMAKVQADPTDTVSMMALGDVFYGAQDFASAATWFQKAFDADPTDSRAQLALGAAWFNAGELDKAEAAWLAVIERNPDDEDALLEANYDLGFLYLNREPPDMEGVQRHWGEVVRISPDSDVAQTVKAHLDALASPAPSAAPSSAPSSEPSAAPSAAPGGSVEP